MDKIKALAKIIDESEKIVFFGGAGVSTESGIPDFRSVDGLYNQKYRYPPEIILSHDFFMDHTAEFFEFYKSKMLYENIKPNAAHIFLAKLEKMGKLKCVITQNIDGLHNEAGSENVCELHGSVLRNFCMSCKKSYTIEHIKNSKGIPRCSCGGIVKPDVVLYQEMLDEKTINQAVEFIKSADTLIIGGTSLKVYPSAGFINYFKGKNLVLINKEETQADQMASLVINSPIGEVFKKIMG